MAKNDIFEFFQTTPCGNSKLEMPDKMQNGYSAIIHICSCFEQGDYHSVRVGPYCFGLITCLETLSKNTAKRNMSSAVCASSMYSRLCTKMSSFLFVHAWAMPRILYLLCGIPFPVWTPGIISGLDQICFLLHKNPT